MRCGLAYSFPEAAEPFAVLFIRDTAKPPALSFRVGFENTRVEHTAETCVDLASDVPIIDRKRHRAALLIRRLRRVIDLPDRGLKTAARRRPCAVERVTHQLHQERCQHNIGRPAKVRCAVSS